MPVTVRFDPTANSLQSQIIPDASPNNDGVMNKSQAAALVDASPWDEPTQVELHSRNFTKITVVPGRPAIRIPSCPGPDTVRPVDNLDPSPAQTAIAFLEKDFADTFGPLGTGPDMVFRGTDNLQVAINPKNFGSQGAIAGVFPIVQIPIPNFVVDAAGLAPWSGQRDTSMGAGQVALVVENFHTARIDYATGVPLVQPPYGFLPFYKITGFGIPNQGNPCQDTPVAGAGVHNYIFPDGISDFPPSEAFGLNPTTLTDNPLTAGAVTVNVVSTAGFPTGPGILLIDNEFMTYTAVTPTSFTGVTRGVRGSTAAAHAVNSQVRSIEGLFFLADASFRGLGLGTPLPFSGIGPRVDLSLGASGVSARIRTVVMMPNTIRRGDIIELAQLFLSLNLAGTQIVFGAGAPGFGIQWKSMNYYWTRAPFPGGQAGNTSKQLVGAMAEPRTGF